MILDFFSRLMMSEQGVPVKNVSDFAWKCRDVEDQTVDTEPPIPKFIVAKVNQDAMQEQKRLFETNGTKDSHENVTSVA